MHNKVKFRKVTEKEIKGLITIVMDFLETITLKESDFERLTVGYVLYDLVKNKLYKTLELVDIRKKSSFTLVLQQATALYVALECNERTDYFYKHIKTFAKLF